MNESLPGPIDAWRAIVVAHDSLMQELAPRLRAHGLTVPQYDVLLRLLRAPDHTVAMGDLARSLLYSSGAATKLVDRLVTLGHVTRHRSPEDGRVVLIATTPQGLELVRVAGREHAQDITRLVGGFTSDDEARHVMAFLRRITPVEHHANE